MQLVKHILQNHNLSTCSGSPANQELSHPPVTTSSSTGTQDENQQVIHRLFLKLAATYGNTWRNLFKSQEFLQFSKREWLDALSGYEEKVLYQAVVFCRENQAILEAMLEPGYPT